MHSRSMKEAWSNRVIKHQHGVAFCEAIVLQWEVMGWRSPQGA